MNLYDQALMDRPSVETDVCCICGIRLATERHHVIPRSRQGHAGPTVTVCGWGNTSGCHGLLHSHKAHLRYTDRWEVLLTEEPVKYEKAIEMEGWRPLYGQDER